MSNTTARQSQGKLTRNLASGEDGLVSVVTDSAANYEADPTMLPSDFGDDMNAKQAVANYGGYIHAHKGVSVSTIVGFANAIAKRYKKLDEYLLSHDDAGIVMILGLLDSEVTNENETREAENLRDGTTANNQAKRLVALADELAITLSNSPTQGAYDKVRATIRRLEDVLADASVSVKKEMAVA